MTSEFTFAFRSLLDAAPDGILVANGEGVIVFVNRTAEELFGYAPGELADAEVERLIPERLHRGHVGHRRGYFESPRVRPMGLGLNLVGRRKNGSEFPIEISLSPLETSEGTLVTAVIRDVTERRRLEDERNHLAVELETERERDRIAMDLHDGIMQDIYAAALTLELAVDDMRSAREEAQAGVERAIDQLHDVVRNIRSYIFDLRPREFSGSLPQALSDLAREFQQNSQIGTSVEIPFDVDVEMETAVAVYQIAHESLSNIQRHARAKLVTIFLRGGGAEACLEIRDDGVGFDPERQQSEHHRGLRNMAARARAVSAVLTVESKPGSGTRTSITFPTCAES